MLQTRPTRKRGLVCVGRRGAGRSNNLLQLFSEGVASPKWRCLALGFSNTSQRYKSFHSWRATGSCFSLRHPPAGCWAKGQPSSTELSRLCPRVMRRWYMSKQLCYQVVGAVLPHNLLKRGEDYVPSVGQDRVTGADLESLELWNSLPWRRLKRTALKIKESWLLRPVKSLVKTYFLSSIPFRKKSFWQLSW